MANLIEALLNATAAQRVGETDGVITITDQDGDREPTEQELIDAGAEIVILQANHDANKYQRDRSAEYPAIQDQLDMIFHDLEDGTKLWQQKIRSIKTKYPKV